jgi:hypothetical protein
MKWFSIAVIALSSTQASQLKKEGEERRDLVNANKTSKTYISISLLFNVVVRLRKFRGLGATTCLVATKVVSLLL